MKNITVFTVFVIFFFTQSAFARENTPGNYAFSLSPCFGMVYGHAEELVYPSDTIAPLLSELLWDIKPVFYYGLLLDFSRTGPTEQIGFFSNLSVKFGIPRSSGKMEDRDWMSVENNALTHYSIHDNHTKELFFLDFSAGVSFPLQQTLLLKTYVSFSYMHFRFSGKNGYGIYARGNPPDSGIFFPIDDNPNRETFSGKVINYTQEWLTVAPGVSLGYYFLENFFAEISFKISPLVFCTDLDEHFTRDLQFRDYMQGGLFLEPGAALSFSCNSWIAVAFEFSWRYISGTKGQTYLREPIGTGKYTQAGTAGAGLSVINTGLFLKITL